MPKCHVHQQQRATHDMACKTCFAHKVRLFVQNSVFIFHFSFFTPVGLVSLPGHSSSFAHASRLVDYTTTQQALGIV